MRVLKRVWGELAPQSIGRASGRHNGRGKPLGIQRETDIHHFRLHPASLVLLDRLDHGRLAGMMGGDGIASVHDIVRHQVEVIEGFLQGRDGLLVVCLGILLVAGLTGKGGTDDPVWPDELADAVGEVDEPVRFVVVVFFFLVLLAVANGIFPVKVDAIAAKFSALCIPLCAFDLTRRTIESAQIT